MKKIIRFTALLIVLSIFISNISSAEIDEYGVGSYMSTGLLMTDGNYAYTTEDNSIVRYNLEGGGKTVLYTANSSSGNKLRELYNIFNNRYIWFCECYETDSDFSGYTKVLDLTTDSVNTVDVVWKYGFGLDNPMDMYGGKVYFANCPYSVESGYLYCADADGSNLKVISEDFAFALVIYDNKLHFVEKVFENMYDDEGNYNEDFITKERVIQTDLDGSNKTALVDWTELNICAIDKNGYYYSVEPTSEEREAGNYTSTDYYVNYKTGDVSEYTDTESLNKYSYRSWAGHCLILLDGVEDMNSYMNRRYYSDLLEYGFDKSETDSSSVDVFSLDRYSSEETKIGTMSIDDTKFDVLYVLNGYLYYITYTPPGDNSSVSLTEKFSQGDIKKVKLSSLANDYSSSSEVDLDFDSALLEGVTDSDSANALLESVVSGMSSAEIASVKAKDQLAYLAEEAAARAATIEAEGDIVIDQENTEDALSTVSAVVDSAESIISSSDVGVKSVRNKVRYSTSKSSSVSISKENITADVDVVEAVTPFGSFEFEPDSVSELTVDSDGTNKISVSFNKTDSTSKVTVKFPNVTSDGYKAVVDEDGNVIGGKYNPITDELSAKIEESGVFTVVTNEKDFSDIKSQPAEVQAAIKKLASKGIIKGTSETEFSPDSPITRAEIAALIVRILDADDPNADGGFSDVTKENWYFGSAGSSKRENIIAGYEDNTFRGTVVIPKVQITSVTARVLTNRLGYYSASESVLNEFTDADTIASWARSDVALAAYANMVIRRTDGSFEPNMEMTRGDAAVILEKLFDKVW